MKGGGNIRGFKSIRSDFVTVTQGQVSEHFTDQTAHTHTPTKIHLAPNE